MMVHDLDVFGPYVRPTEAQAKLIVNADAMLARTVPFQNFQPIPGRNTQIT
jgi:hypothetical protein